MVAVTRSSHPMQIPGVRSPTKRQKPPRHGKACTRRHLFDDGPESPPPAAALAPEAEEPFAPPPPEPCDMERHPSSDSSLTHLEGGGGDAGPGTPEHQSAARPPAVWDAATEAPMAYTLQVWRQQLVQLQPLVQLGDHVLLGVLCVLRELAACRADLALALQASPPHLYTYLASALWTVAKLTGVRTQIPNRSLVSQATSVNPQALSDYEMDLLTSLDWGVAGILARNGLLSR